MPDMLDFIATRAAGQERLAARLPALGRQYATRRNFDVAPSETSALSPWLRHRLLSEREVLAAVLDAHGPHEAEKFIAEVIWRSYWKGWLEMRPSVWADYRRDLGAALNRVQTEAGLRADFEAACLGQTGIDCFDHWARQLADTGWLHNHARMWFASIWIFTLRLPWELGADLFLRQLLDGDPASNTLGWRWVAGIQTRGKHYVATAENIRRFTEGRFDPRGVLNEDPAALDAPEPPPPGALPISVPISPDIRTGVLTTTEDLSPGPVAEGAAVVATFALDTARWRSPLKVAANVADFSAAALRDGLERANVTFGTDAEAVEGWIRDNDLQQVVFAHAPTGPGGDCIADLRRVCDGADVRLAPQVRPYDTALWPHATRGFFRFRKDIPDVATLI